MRFMYIVTSPQPDAAARRPALMEAMDKLADREIKAGRMLDSGGLMPLARRARRCKITDGKLSVVDGPFVEAKEVIGGYAIFELRDKEEALAAAQGVHAAAPRPHAGLGRHLRGSRPWPRRGDEQRHAMPACKRARLMQACR